MSNIGDFLIYNPDTGDSFWKVRSGRMVAGSPSPHPTGQLSLFG